MPAAPSPALGRDTILSDLPRGDPARPLEQYSPPGGAFVSPADVAAEPAVAWKPGRLFLGVIDGRVSGRAPAHHVTGGHAVGVTDDRHVITVAGSRSGKGRSAIIPNMLHWPGSVLATDPKGELATITARRRKEGLGQDVAVLDPFGVTRGYPAEKGLLTGFNPIEAMRPGNLAEDAALIADALVVVAGKDPHWDESARAFIEGVILHLKTWDDYEGRRNLLTLRELVGGDKAALDRLDGGMRMNKAGGGVVQSAAADFFDRPQNEKGSVLSSARRHLKFIDLFRDSAGGRRTLESGGFQLDALKTRPTTVYLCLPARHIGTCNRWLRLFVNLTLQNMERIGGPSPGGAPVLCVLDEFASLGHMQQIEAAAGQIAGFGVKLWPVLQDLGQLKALYEARWETFLGNAGVLQFFGNNDLTTLEWMSRRCGKTAIRVRTDKPLTVDQVHAGLTGESWATEIHDLLGLDEAARYFARDDRKLRQLVIWGGFPPLVLQRAFYDQHALFAGLFDPPP
jgi:type IV secretion system protein VirD4